MGRTLKFIHRLRIDALNAKRQFPTLDIYLEKLAGKGFDVAGIPFQLVDSLLASGSDVDVADVVPLARHTVGGQPRLLAAVLKDLGQNSAHELHHLALDTMAHPMTRFEAMGWATYVTHKAIFPDQGTPVTDVFQFWDHQTPPPEIMEGKKLWQNTAKTHLWYDDTLAQNFIADGFGKSAAEEYSRLWHPALKSDVFRLYRLVKDGGVYCDADGRPEYRAADFLKLAGDRVWATSMTNVPNCVTNNWFIAAPARNPLIEGLLDQVLRNIRDVGSRGIFWLSGPGAFTTFLYTSREKYDIGLLSQGTVKEKIFRQFDADYKYTEKNWRVYEHNNDLGNEAGLIRALPTTMDGS